ncbi:hypothetical protein [Pseudostreptobacillus hongkongensis]|uniref:hypothetical protein n=1 Tax=Pseudostreptobacillus hongkongensis TaxID=1162717 RepID=UPI000B1AD192|nr:hypothetical protein [Pseudostreptobacillus hongkongensis]
MHYFSSVYVKDTNGKREFIFSITLAAKEGLGITYKDKISTELNAGFPGYVGVSIGGRF